MSTSRRSFLRAALIAGTPVFATTTYAAGRRCPACKGTGKVVCRAHHYTHKGRFRLVCTLCRPPSCCKGIGWRPCKRCNPAEVQAEWEEEVDDWREEVKHETGYPGKFGEPLKRAATRHFRIQGPFTHKRFHLYGEKLERLHAYVVKLLGDDTEELLPWTRCGIGVFGRTLSYHKFVRHIDSGQHGWLEMALRAAGTRQSSHPRAVQNGQGRTDKQILHSLTHAVGHIYASTYSNSTPPPDWLGEGFAGHCERMIMDSPQTYCIAYGGGKRESDSLWRATLAIAIRKEELRPFEELAMLDISTMNAVDWAHAIGCVELLVRKPDAFRKFLLDMKQNPKSDAAAAIKKHYNLTVKQFDFLWKKNFKRIR